MGEVAKGDHTLFVGEVVEAGVRGEDQTILMCDHNLNDGSTTAAIAGITTFYTSSSSCNPPGGRYL